MTTIRPTATPRIAHHSYVSMDNACTENDRRTNINGELSADLVSNMAVLYHNNGNNDVDGSSGCGDDGCHGEFGGERDNNIRDSCSGGGASGRGGGGGGSGGGSGGDVVDRRSVRSDTGRSTDVAADRSLLTVEGVVSSVKAINRY